MAWNGMAWGARGVKLSCPVVSVTDVAQASKQVSQHVHLPPVQFHVLHNKTKMLAGSFAD